LGKISRWLSRWTTTPALQDGSLAVQEALYLALCCILWLFAWIRVGLLGKIACTAVCRVFCWESSFAI